MSKWQPIETAPHVVDQYILVCSYDEMVDHDGKPFELYWCDVVQWVESPNWKPEGGWFNGDRTQDPDHYDYWQPLPAPPNKKAPPLPKE